VHNILKSSKEMDVYTQNNNYNNNLTNNYPEHLIDVYLMIMIRMRAFHLLIQADLPLLADNKKLEVPILRKEETEILLMPILSDEQKEELSQYNKISFKYTNNYGKYNVLVYKLDDSYSADFELLNE